MPYIYIHIYSSQCTRTIMEVLPHLTCSYAIKSGPRLLEETWSAIFVIWLLGYTPGNPEANAITDSFLCLVNGTKKLVNVLTGAKDIGFDPSVTSAYLPSSSLFEKRGRRVTPRLQRKNKTTLLLVKLLKN